MDDSTKSLLDKLKDLNDSKKSLQDMKINIEEHTEMLRKAPEDYTVANALLKNRLNHLRKFLSKMRNKQDDSGEMHAIYRRWRMIMTKIGQFRRLRLVLAMNKGKCYLRSVRTISLL
jgi:hypothetical protein